MQIQGFTTSSAALSLLVLALYHFSSEEDSLCESTQLSSSPGRSSTGDSGGDSAWLSIPMSDLNNCVVTLQLSGNFNFNFRPSRWCTVWQQSSSSSPNVSCKGVGGRSYQKLQHSLLSPTTKFFTRAEQLECQESSCVNSCRRHYSRFTPKFCEVYKGRFRWSRPIYIQNGLSNLSHSPRTFTIRLSVPNATRFEVIIFEWTSSLTDGLVRRYSNIIGSLSDCVHLYRSRLFCTRGEQAEHKISEPLLKGPSFWPSLTKTNPNISRVPPKISNTRYQN